MRRRQIAVAALTLTAIVATAAPADARTVDPERWARSFCGALVDWGEGIDVIGPDIKDAIADAQEKADLRKARDVLEDAMRQFRRVTRRAGKRIEKAGQPDVPNGSEISERFVDAFDDLAGFLADAADEAADLPVDDVEEFQDAAADVARGLDRGNETIDDAFDDVEQLDEELDLGDALERVSACNSITGG